MERFSCFVAAGPILQGFGIRWEDESLAPAIISDLSRGSTVEDVVLTFRMLEKIYSYDNAMSTRAAESAAKATAKAATKATIKAAASKKSFTQRLLDAWDFAGNFGRRKQ